MKSFIQHLSEQKPSIKTLVAANAKDLKELPGAAGEAAHKRLHKTIAAFAKNSSKQPKSIWQSQLYQLDEVASN